MNTIFRSRFNVLKYFFLQSENNTLEKFNIPYKYFEGKIKSRYEKFIPHLTDEFDFILDVLILNILKVNHLFFLKINLDSIQIFFTWKFAIQ